MALQSFEQFSKANTKKIAFELESNNTVVREESARTFRDLLKEYGVTKVSELDEENREEFFSRIQGIGVNESGKYLFKGADILKSINNLPEFETFLANEAVIITGKRDAKKVLNQYIKIFNEYPAFINKNAKLHGLGVLKQIFFNAMEDANFSREAYPIMKKIKGNIGAVVVKLVELSGMELKIPGSKINEAIEEVSSRISNAAGYSGIGIVEGTALYLESLGEPKMAEDLVNGFQAQFEGEDVRVNISSKLNESKKINEGKVKQFEMDYKDMETSIKRGIGWIDPEYVIDTWENSSDSIDFELVKGEIYSRLIKAGLLAYADENGEEAGKYIKSLKELGIKESVVIEGNAFGDAVRKAKEAGDEEFEFDGKTYKVTESNMISSEWIVGETYPEYGTVISITNNRGIQEIRFESGEVVKYGYGVKVEESTVTEGKDDYVARYSGTNITLKKGYKHHTEEELQKLYNKIGELVKDDLKVKDVTIVFESLVNESELSSKANPRLYTKVENKLKSQKYNRDAEYHLTLLKAMDPKKLSRSDLDTLSDFDDMYESVITEAKPAGLTKEETLKVAQKFADAIAEVDGVKVTVNMKTLEEDSFDLDYDGTEFDGGSYNINADGSVVNMAVRKQPTVGTKDDDVKTIVKFMKKHYGKLAKNESAVKVAESLVNEAEIKSDDEFKEYAFTVLKKAFGDDFDEAKAGDVVDGILGKVDGDYGAAVGMLTSSLG